MSYLEQTPLDPQVLRKLDGGLRLLFEMTEEGIRKAVKKEQRRRQNWGRQLAASPRAVPEAAAAAPAPAKVMFMPHPIWGVVRLSRERLRPIKVRAITHFAGNREDLVSLGLSVHSHAHDIFTIEGTPAELRNLALQPATAVVRLPHILLPQVEQASAQAEIADVHQPRFVNPSGYRGQGIIVGLIDSPLDVRHATFREATGSHSSRVLYYWVQNPDSSGAPGQTPEDFDNAAFLGLNYGRLYTQSYINAALAPGAVTYGNGSGQISKALDATKDEHGTHTAGIAVGNGHDASYTVGLHVGAAPEAKLIRVTLDDQEDSFINAIDFIFRAADREGMRAVISVSLGGWFGPHDGNTLFDQGRDNLLNSYENRSIVWSAGNDNNNDAFTSDTIGAGSSANITVRPASNYVYLDVWSTGPELEIELSRSTLTTLLTTGSITAGHEYHDTLGTSAVDIDRDPEPDSSYHGIRVGIFPTSAAHEWAIKLNNPHGSDSAGYWLWAGQHTHVSNPKYEEYTISDTGCSRSIITVGACEKVVPSANAAVGEGITDYSGRGPTLDGRIKPEITAVGGISGNEVFSAGSLVLNNYVGNYGTSMSAPLVAGLVALIMEERELAGASIDQDMIKGLLIQYANRFNLHLDPTLSGFVEMERNQYGYGRARAIGPIDHHLPPQNVDVYVKTAPDDFGLVPYFGDRYWIAPEIKICPQGSSTATDQLEWGHLYDVTITVRNLGDNDAVGTEVSLKYTRPYTAPDHWCPAQSASDQPLYGTMTVPALGHADMHFVWRPDIGEIPPPYPDTHFCVLAEVSHPVYDILAPISPSASDHAAWELNIRGTNNIALHNVNIN